MVTAPMQELGARAKASSKVLALASTAEKNAALHAAADLLEAGTDRVLEANAADVAAAENAGTTATVVDRLRLDPRRVSSMANGLRDVAALAAPVGQTVEGWVRPNGLEIRQVRV